LLNPLKFAEAEGCEVLRGKLILDIVERVKQRHGEISSQHNRSNCAALPNRDSPANGYSFPAALMY